MTQLVAALFKAPMDPALAALVLDDERSTKKFAVLLGIAHLPASEQRKIVKREKDRIMKVFDRQGIKCLACLQAAATKHPQGVDFYAPAACAFRSLCPLR